MGQAIKTHMDNSLVAFVPLGLGQMYRVLQGCEVRLFLPSRDWCTVQTRANIFWMQCIATRGVAALQEQHRLCASHTIGA